MRSGSDPSTEEAYYQPLLDELDRLGQPVGRIEIPLTLRHFEAAYVAPVVPIARGGERQLDIALNGLFYRDGPLNPGVYRRWLLDNGVRYVALPDAPLDEAAEAEAVLLKTGPSFLTPVWTGAHWRLWRVVGGDGMVDGPASLVAQTPETVVLDSVVPRRGGGARARRPRCGRSTGRPAWRRRATSGSTCRSEHPGGCSSIRSSWVPGSAARTEHPRRSSRLTS